MGERWTATENEKEVTSPRKKERGNIRGRDIPYTHTHVQTDRQTKKNDPSFTVEVES